jgi:hypothetical protein
MTTRVEPVPTPPRTRRALLAGALGGLAAWAASAAARADQTAAAAGDPIRMGQINSPGGKTTTLQMAGGSGAAMRVVQGGGGSAVRAESTSGRAVQARAGSDGTGVWAYSPDHYGVYAQTDSGVAVRAEAWGAGGTAVTGGSVNGRGIFGWSETGYAGDFTGKVRFSMSLDIVPAGTPLALDNGARLFVRNPAGKLELCIRFPGSDPIVLATQP